MRCFWRNEIRTLLNGPPPRERQLPCFSKKKWRTRSRRCISNGNPQFSLAISLTNCSICRNRIMTLDVLILHLKHCATVFTNRLNDKHRGIMSAEEIWSSFATDIGLTVVLNIRKGVPSTFRLLKELYNHNSQNINLSGYTLREAPPTALLEHDKY